MAGPQVRGAVAGPPERLTTGLRGAHTNDYAPPGPNLVVEPDARHQAAQIGRAH